MNCQEVQIELSNYLEKSLDSLRIKSIEMHLQSCPLCREETDGILDCIEQVAQLPMIDPPAGFAQRIMAQIREIEVKPTFWWRIFPPFKIGMPLQATAVVLVAILAVSLYQKEPPIKNNQADELGAPAPPMQLPSERKENSVSDSTQPVAPAQPIAKDAKRDLNPSVTIAQRSAAEAQRKTLADSRLSKEEAPAAPPPSARTENNATEFKDAPRRPPIQAQEVATGRENFRPSGDAFDIGTTLSGSLRSGIFAPPSSLSPLAEPSADVEFIVHRRDNQRRDQKDNASGDVQRQRAEVDTLTSAAKSKSAGSAAAAPQVSSITEIRWFTVPAERYDEFRKELAVEAAIESEKTVGIMSSELAAKSNRDLLIKVTILTPSER
jgi:hypothetical protein